MLGRMLARRAALLADALPRSVAVVAHVDAGKSTLVNWLLPASDAAVSDRAMDSGELESERGITIRAKCASVTGHGGAPLHLVDTPGHAAFGAEVERALAMVQGVVLLVCAAEGPMPQTA